MIISIRGMSGSGKSTLVRRLVETRGAGVPHYIGGRRKPLFSTYACGLAVLGHYEIKNGGIDTLKHLDDAYALAAELSNAGRTVVMEGKCMSDGVRHVVALAEEGRDVRVIFLSTSFETCVESVRLRGHNIARHSMERTHRKIQRDLEMMRSVRGVQLFVGHRNESFDKLVEWVG